MYRFGVPILRVLNEKDRQVGYDRRRGVDDELPRVRKIKKRTRKEPHQYQKDICYEHPRRTEQICRDRRKTAENPSYIHKIRPSRKADFILNSFAGYEGYYALLFRCFAVRRIPMK